MNNKADASMGVWLFFGMMIGLMIWIAYTQMIGPLTDATQDARAATTAAGFSGLDCDNSSISIGTKGTCVIVDFMGFGWSGGVIAMILGALGAAIIKKKTETPN